MAAESSPASIKQLVGAIALDFLLWEPRVQIVFDGGARTERPWKSRTVQAQFKQHFLDGNGKSWSEEDFDSVAREVRGDFSLLDCMSAIVGGYELDVASAGRAVALPFAALKSWTEVSDRLNVDHVLTFLLSPQWNRDDDNEHLNWGFVPQISDEELAALTGRGVSDLHVHVGGARNGVTLWHSVLSGRIDKRRVWGYRDTNDENEEEARRLQHVIDEFPADVFERKRRTASGQQEDIPASSLLAPQADLIDERAYMVSSWARLRRAEDNSFADKDDIPFERKFDLFLSARNAFLMAIRQPALGGNPGLQHFRGYYRANEALTTAQRTDLSRLRNNKVWRLQHRDMAYAISRSENLKLLELRIAPFDTTSAYDRFFRIWEKVEEELEPLCPGLKTRFAVNFVRTLGKAPKGAEADWGRWLLRQKLDRETAVLHLFRQSRTAADRSRRIERVDLAGQERDSAPSLAIPYMNLVRGSKQAIADLNAGASSIAHRRWLHLSRHGKSHSPAYAPRLKVTCHAGEDCAHPLDGVAAVSAAADGLQMTAGDTIGHGLALGWDLELFLRRRGRTIVTERGTQFDSVLWLHERLRRRGGREFSPHLAEIDDWLRCEIEEIYGSELQTNEPARLHGLLRERFKCVPLAEPKGGTPAQRAHWLETAFGQKEGSACRDARVRRVVIAPAVWQWSACIAWAQNSVMSELIDRGIVLELNPSSNIRIAPSSDVQYSPFIRLLKNFSDTILATVNTDNPGVFGTRIENEYALLLDGLLEADVKKTDAVAMLERIRRTGRGELDRPIVL